MFKARFLMLAACLSVTTTTSAKSADGINHQLPKINSTNAELTVRSKRYGDVIDKVYVDGQGREVSLRGFNVSGKVKLAQYGFQPFANVNDASTSFATLKQQVGSNMVRYTVAWEGIHTAPNVIDYDYLDNAIAYMKAAIANGMYVLVDYHSDLYSRHTFKKDSKDTGNGAPEWAVHPVNGKDDCGLPCMITWSAHKLSDSAARNAMKSFWYDHWVMDRNLNNIELYLPHNNQCADIRGGSTWNGTPIISWSCHGRSNQRWNYLSDGSLRSVRDTNKCLDISGAGTHDNNKVQIYHCNNTKAQTFIVDRKGRLHSAIDFNKCLVNNRGRIVINECQNGNQQQVFQLRNADIRANIGDQLTYVQSSFVWQIGQVARYLKQNMSAYEFAHVLGFEPLNEPYDGGVGRMTYKEFDNQILWPFYQRVRAELDKQKINKPVYAEPMVFWSSIAGFTAPATGGSYLNYQPGDGFIFTPHFYDQARMGVNDLSVARNAAHFKNLDLIRDESRFLGLATFVSEFGMWLDGKGHTDTERVVNGTYQALESSDRQSGKDRYVDFYTPLISGAQWQWDMYYDNHYEFQNGNTSKLKTKDDAWNGENFSVIKNYGKGYNVKQELIERAYPRAVQGEVMHFAYEGLVPDEGTETMSYHSIRTSLADQFQQREFFRNRKFAFLTWRGRTSDAPTEVYIPRHINPGSAVLMTEKGIFKNLAVDTPLKQQANEVAFISDTNNGTDAGHVALIWDDKDPEEDNTSYHFVLIVDGDAGLSNEQLQLLQASLVETINREKSPVYLTNRMTEHDYPGDMGTSL